MIPETPTAERNGGAKGPTVPAATARAPGRDGREEEPDWDDPAALTLLLGSGAARSPEGRILGRFPFGGAFTSAPGQLSSNRHLETSRPATIPTSLPLPVGPRSRRFLALEMQRVTKDSVAGVASAPRQNPIGWLPAKSPP